MKIYLASDMHIGIDDSNYPAILDFFKLVQSDGDELILLGDTFDLWLNSFNNITTREPYKAAYDALMKTSSRVPTTMVCGNHDYDLRNHLRNPNIKIEDRFTRGTCRYMHGWELDALQVTASSAYVFMLELFPYFYQKYIYKPRDQRYGLTHNDITNAFAKKYVKDKGFSYILYGHTHEPMIEGPLLNCGDFVEHASFITITEGVAELWNIENGKKVKEPS